MLPYRQNYTYDAFGMLTGRQSTLWTEENWDFSDTFINNRRTSGWVYDHQGNATYAEQINYEYDSTNMMTKTWRAQSHEMTIGHDGVGREGKRSHRSWDSEEEEWGDWETRFFVHSTVLGQTLSELSQTGTKVRTFVVAAGTVVARQFYDSGSNEAVSWELADASGQSIRMANATGGYTDVDSGGAELDALGNNVGIHGSLQRNAQTEPSPFDRDPIAPEIMCNENGIVGACSIVELLTHGQTFFSSGPELPFEAGARRTPRNRNHPWFIAQEILNETSPPFDRQGYDDYRMGRRETAPNSRHSYGSVLLDYLIGSSMPAGTDDDPIDFRNNASARAQRMILDNDRCSKFVAFLIENTSADLPFVSSGRSRLSDFNGNEIQDDVSVALSPLIRFAEAEKAGRVTSSGKSGRDSRGTQYAKVINNSQVIFNNEFYGLGLDAAAIGVLHESLHLFRGFSDQALARAASSYNRGRASSFPDGDDGQRAASEYLTGRLEQFCLIRAPNPSNENVIR